MKPIICITLIYDFKSTVKSLEEVLEAVTAVTASRKSRFKRSKIRRVFLALVVSIYFDTTGYLLLQDSCLGLRSDEFDLLCKRSMLTF